MAPGPNPQIKIRRGLSEASASISNDFGVKTTRSAELGIYEGGKKRGGERKGGEKRGKEEGGSSPVEPRRDAP